MPGLGDRKGKRREMASSALETDANTKSTRGGVRKRDPNSKIYQTNLVLHPDAQKVQQEKLVAFKPVKEDVSPVVEASLWYLYGFCIVLTSFHQAKATTKKVNVVPVCYCSKFWQFLWYLY